MAVAFNDATGEALRLDTSGAWVPTTLAAHPQTGERLALDGEQWVSLGKPPVDVAGEVGAVGSGINRGVANMLGMPVDLINAGLGLAGLGSDAPVGGSEWFKDRLGNVIDIATLRAPDAEGPSGREIIDQQAQTRAGRIGARVGEEVGGALVPMAGALAIPARATVATVAPALRSRVAEVAARGLPAGETVAPGASGALTASRSSGATAVRDALAGTGNLDRAAQLGISGAAGLGAGMAQEAAPGNRLAELGGALAGGLAGGVGLYGAGFGINALRPFMSEEARQGAAGLALRSNISDPTALARLSVAETELVPGSPLTTAQSVQDPGLAQLERTLRAERPDKFAPVDAARAAGQRAEIQRQAPAGPGAETVGQMSREELARIEGEGAARVGQAGQSVGRELERLGPGQGPVAAGGVIREELGAARTAAKRGESNLWQQLEQNEDLALETGATRDAAARMLGEINADTGAPAPFVQAILDRAAEWEDVKRFRDVANFRKRLTNAQSALRRSAEPTAPTDLRRIETVLRGLDDDIARAAGDEPGPVIGQAPLDPRGGTSPEGPRTGIGQAVLGPRAASDAVYTPDGMRVETEWRLVDLAGPDAPIVSNTPDFRPNPEFPEALQPRDRGRAASQAQVVKMAGDLNPERLGAGGAGDGAPIIGPDRVTESGNGRLLAIDRAYRNGGPRAEEYRRWIEGQGFDTSGMQRPALVRMRTTPLDDAGRVRWTEGANAGPGQALSATEQAAVDAGRLGDDALALYRSGEVDDAANIDLQRAFVRGLPAGESGRLASASGALSLEGKRRLEAALLHKVFGNDGGLVSALVETGDDNIRALGRALTEAAPRLAQLRAAIAKGDVPADFDPVPALLDAVRVVQRARRDGVPIGDVLRQQDAFTRIDPAAETFLAAVYGDGFRRVSGRRAVQALETYIGDALQQTGGGGLFGGGPSAGDIWQAAQRRARGIGDDTETAAPASGGGGGGVPAGGGGDVPGAGGSGGGGGSSIVDDGLTPNFGPDERDLYRAAREATAERKQTFDRGAVGQALQRGGYQSRDGQYLMPVEQVAGRFFNAGKASDTDLAEFVRAAEGRPAAAQALQDYAVGDLRRAAVDDAGRVDARKWANWMRQHSAALGSFPELRARFASVRAAQETLERAETEAADAIKAFGRSAAGRFIERDANKAFAAVVNSANRTADLRELVRLARGDQEKLGALRRSVVDEMMRRIENSGAVDATGESTLSAAKTTNFLKELAEPLQRSGLMKREHIDALRSVEQDMRRAVFVNTAGRAIGSNTYQNFASGAFLMQVTMGLVRPGNPVLATLGRPIAWIAQVPDREVRKLLIDAMLDPRAAALLARKSTPDAMNWVGAMLKRRAVALGITVPAQAAAPPDTRRDERRAAAR